MPNPSFPAKPVFAAQATKQTLIQIDSGKTNSELYKLSATAQFQRRVTSSPRCPLHRTVLHCTLLLHVTPGGVVSRFLVCWADQQIVLLQSGAGHSSSSSSSSSLV